jgi:mono/diheme cytochrome c family protein
VTNRIPERAFSKSGLALAGAALLATMGGFLAAAQASAADTATTTGTAAAAAAAKPDPGKEIFLDWGCGSCHSLADAGADGHVGPVFDGDPNLTKDFVIGRVTNGQGAMPSFGGQLTEKEISELADYIVKAAAKPDSSS